MGELRAGAERLAEVVRQQRAAADEREKAAHKQQEEWIAMHPRAHKLLREFMGELATAKIPTIPLYQPQERMFRQRMYPYGMQSYTSNYVRLGDGWLAAEEHSTYEDGTTPGIFVGKSVVKGEIVVMDCGKVQRGPLSGARDFNETGDYVVADRAVNLDAPSPDPNAAPVLYAGPPLFATKAGQDILEAALVRYGVVK